jgi:hypothetical protein
MATIIAIICIIVTIYLGDQAHWFDFLLHGIELGYPPQLVYGAQAALFLCFLIGFILRNDVESYRGSRHKD